MLLLLVLAVVLVGVGAVVARQGRARPGPPAQHGDGFGGFDAGSGPSSSAASDDSLPLNLAAGSLAISAQMQANHTAQSLHPGAHHHDAPHHNIDLGAGVGNDAGSPDSGSTDSGGGDAGGGGGDP